MVKLPSFAGLKKLGSDLFDATKSINFKEVVAHFKSGEQAPQAQERIQQLFPRIRNMLQELSSKVRPGQENLVQQLGQKVNELEKAMANYQTSTNATQLFQSIRGTLQELNRALPGQENLIKQLEQQVIELEKIMGNYQKSAGAT